MFKKKSDTMTRPKPPVTKHILEDLINAKDDDPVFTIVKDNSFNVSESRAGNLRSDEDVVSERRIENEPQETFRIVRHFVDTNNELQRLVQLLKEQCESLQMSDVELRMIAEDIRKQARDALK